jgi:hypothetical protein
MGPRVEWIRATQRGAGDGAGMNTGGYGRYAVALWQCLWVQGTLTQSAAGPAMGLGGSWAPAGLCVEEGGGRSG